MQVFNWFEYGDDCYYEIGINPAQYNLPSDPWGNYRIIIRVHNGENHLLIIGTEAYVEAKLTDDGAPYDINGPTLSMYQVQQHARDGTLDSWLAGRQQGDSNLIPIHTMFLLVLILEAADPGRYVP